MHNNLKTKTLKRNKSVLVQLKNINKIFRNGKKVIENFNLIIYKSDFITILGKSGSGKTTILKILCGLLKVTSGKVIWPTSTYTNSEKNPANLSVVFQESNLLPWLNVFENVFLPLKLKKINSSKGKKEVKKIINLVGLGEFQEYFPNQLSGGMKMRVAIARALVTKPKVILMDEPFAALDEITRFKLNDDLLRIYKKYKLTIIFITHSIYESAYLSNKIALISDGPAQLKEIINLEIGKDKLANYRLSKEYIKNCKTISYKLRKYSG